MHDWIEHEEGVDEMHELSVTTNTVCHIVSLVLLGLGGTFLLPKISLVRRLDG